MNKKLSLHKTSEFGSSNPPYLEKSSLQAAMTRYVYDGINDVRYCASKEGRIAEEMYRLMLKEPLLGYEAASHNYYNKDALVEKAIICDNIFEKLRNIKN